MKLVKIALMTFVLAGITLVYTSCGNHAQAANEQGKEYTSAYICPMHCDGSGSEEMGQCPVCGMDYVANENYQPTDEAAHEEDDHSGHDHDGHDHEGHDHSGHDHQQ
ncbi:MAG: heavy metal-binding domain-containing protein [Bacteroidota bacterium]